MGVRQTNWAIMSKEFDDPQWLLSRIKDGGVNGLRVLMNFND